MVLIQNLPVQKKNKLYAGDNGRKFKEEWVNVGFNPINIHHLWDFQEHLGSAIVEFTKDWKWFMNAIVFDIEKIVKIRIFKPLKFRLR